jgi:hypothetical protein
MFIRYTHFVTRRIGIFVFSFRFTLFLLSVNLVPASIHSMSVELRTFSSVFRLGSIKPILHSRLSSPPSRASRLSFSTRAWRDWIPRVCAREGSFSRPSKVNSRLQATTLYGLQWLTVEFRSSTSSISPEKMFSLLNQKFSRKKEPRCSFSPRLERRGRPGGPGGPPAPIDHRASHKKTTSASMSSETSSNNSIQACPTATSKSAPASLYSSSRTAPPRKTVGVKRAILPYFCLYYDILRRQCPKFRATFCFKHLLIPL